MCLSTDFAQLTLLIARLHDADMLLDAEADALLTEVEAAQTARNQGKADTQRHHLAVVAGFVQALMDARLLPDSNGSAVIATARRLAAKAS